MTASALSLVLTSAVLHAVWNIAAKRVPSDGYVFVFCYSVASTLLWLPVGLVVLARSDQGSCRALFLSSAVSGILHIGYALALQTGYNRADLGVVYPVARGTGPLLTMLFAVLVPAERPGTVALVGGLVVVAGVAVVASARSSGRTVRRRGPAVRGVRWGALTGAAIASYTLWDDHSMSTLALLPVPYFAVSNTWQTVLMVPGLRHTGADVSRVARSYWREILCVATLSPIAYVLVLQAMTTTSVALVAPARESSIVVGSLLAWKLFHEPAPARKFAGAVVVLAGIALIAV